MENTGISGKKTPVNSTPSSEFTGFGRALRNHPLHCYHSPILENVGSEHDRNRYDSACFGKPDISLLSIRPGMIALRVKHAGNPKVIHHASDIVALVETLSQPIDPDHELRCKAILARSTAELGAVLAADRGTDSCGQGGAAS